MDECPKQQQLECMGKLGALEKGQQSHEQWLSGISTDMKTLGRDVAFIRGRISERQKSHGKLIAALTIAVTAIGGAIAAIWGGVTQGGK